MIDLILSVPLSPEYAMTRDTHMILIIRMASTQADMKHGHAPCVVHGHEPHVSGDHFIKARSPLSCTEESLTILVIEKRAT
jgi:hypothetical protein